VKIIIMVMLSIGFFIQSVDARERSEKAKAWFKYMNPCPSNGNNHGACPGYVIDHITALACGGNDAPSNMQWQTVKAGKAKDKWERKGCQVGSLGNYSYSGSNSGSSSSEYHTGKRGGCFAYTDTGNKRYVAHSYCGQ
jgi:hypothetical protein